MSHEFLNRLQALSALDKPAGKCLAKRVKKKLLPVVGDPIIQSQFIYSPDKYAVYPSLLSAFRALFARQGREDKTWYLFRYHL